MLLLFYAVPVLLIVIALCLYRSVFSVPEPVPDGIKAVIPRVQNVHFEDLEEELCDHRPGKTIAISTAVNRRLPQARLAWLAKEVQAMKSNAELYYGGACWEFEQIKDRASREETDRD